MDRFRVAGIAQSLGEAQFLAQAATIAAFRDLVHKVVGRAKPHLLGRRRRWEDTPARNVR